jgi:predicted TIM-barrel fold metal-dependent hydrolase
MSTPATTGCRPRIVDAHAHLYDARVNRHGIFQRRDPGFEAFVGDYAALPRWFLPDDYRAAAGSRDIAGIIWHEFISDDPVREVAWAQQVADASDLPMALVGLVDFADPGLPERLDTYHAFPNLTAVRQHLGWDADNPLRRFAARPDLLSDPRWLAGLARLEGTSLRCGLEVFAPQLRDVLAVVRRHPRIGFTIAVMGWPLRSGPEDFRRWQADMRALGHCDNTCASISAIECIFGMGWTAEQVAPWITTVLESFGPGRCMFGSHLPITSLSHGFERLYQLYDSTVAGLSDAERDAVFRTTASRWFRLPARRDGNA